MTTGYRAQAGGVRLLCQIVPNGELPAVLPRLGLRLGLPASLQEVKLVGAGPTPSHPDLTGALLHGAFTATVEQMWPQPVRLQESGNRLDLRQLTLRGDAGQPWDGIPAEAPLSFSLSPGSLETLTAATHLEELQPDQHLWPHLDALHNGVGSRSCGPDVRPAAQARPQPVTLEACLRA